MTTRIRGIGMMMLLLAACAGCSVRSHAIDLPPITGAADDGGGTHPKTGGQSGTDDPGVVGCPPETGRRSVALDEKTRVGTAAELRDRFEQVLAVTPEIPFRWTTEIGGETTLSVELTVGTSATFVETSGHVCDALIVPATLHLTTTDGLLDETLPGELREAKWSGKYDAAAAQGSAIRDELAKRLGEPELELQSFGAWLEVSDGRNAAGGLSATSDSVDESLSETLSELATFDSLWPKVITLDDPYERPTDLKDVCAAASPYISLFAAPDADHLLPDIEGTWVKCSGASTNDRAHDGIRFTSQTWTDLATQDGKLIESLGFGHEGRLEASGADLGMRNALPLNYLSPHVTLSSDRNTMRLQFTDDFMPRAFDETYVRTNLAVQPAKPAHAAGERAGVAACEEGEAHVHLFESEADLRARLEGAWGVCTGGFRSGAKGIVFTKDGKYSHLDASGSTIATGKYVVIDTSDANGEGAFQVNMQDDDGGGSTDLTVPVMSDAPIKLWASDEGHTVLSAMPAASE